MDCQLLMESSSDGDVSLSDLSISDTDIDSDQEEEGKGPEVEPSTWVEIRNCEAANRLAEVLSTTSTPPVDASATSDALDNNNQKSLDCCGRATVALGLEKLCLLLHGSAMKVPMGSEKQKIKLTSSTMRCIEARVGRGGKHSKSTRVASAHKQAISTTFTSNIPAQVDPKLFLSCKDANATSQALVEELDNIVRVQANEATARQNLVCKHFEQFINCKNTIDDIRSVLRSFAEETVSNSSATGNFLASMDDALDALGGEKLIERQKRIIAARRALGEAHSLSNNVGTSCEEHG